MRSLRRLGVLVLLALPCAVPPAFAQTAPTVSAVTIGSSPPRQSRYERGETIRVAVTFTAAVTGTGSPRLALTIGNATRQARYASGSGTTTLTFQYRTQAVDADTDGLSVGASALALNGGTIQSQAGTNAALGLGTHALTHQANHKVNGAATAPAVSSVTLRARRRPPRIRCW